MADEKAQAEAKAKLEAEQEAAKTPQQRAQERLKAQAEAKAKLEADTRSKLSSLSAKFNREGGVQFVPFTDRDGKIVPALVLGLTEDVKRNPKTRQIELDENQQAVPTFRVSAFAFTHVDVPRVVDYQL